MRHCIQIQIGLKKSESCGRDRQTDRYIETDRQNLRQTDKDSKQTDIERQTDIQKDRQTQRQTDRQADREREEESLTPFTKSLLGASVHHGKTVEVDRIIIVQ